MSDQPSTTQVGVRMPDDPRRREWLWAEPVNVRTPGGGGIYRLLNNAICAPFLVGDLVRVRRSGRYLTVESLHQRGGRTGYAVHFTLGTAEKDALAICDSWAATGCAVEGVGGLWFTVAVDHAAGQRPTQDELQALVAAGWLDQVQPTAPSSDAQSAAG